MGQKITQLPITTSSSDSDVLPIVASGVTSQISKVNLLNQMYGPQYFGVFNTKLVNVATTPVDIVMFGDSKTEGTAATDASQTWVQLFLQKLRNVYQPVGVTGGFGYVPGAYATPTFTQPWTLGGAAVRNTSAAAGNYGLGKRSITLSASGDTASITVGPGTIFGGVTSVDVVYSQGSAQGKFTVTVDGGSPTTVDASTGGTVIGKRYRVSGLGPTTSHTILVSWLSTNYIVLEGIMLYNGDENAGIRMWNGGHHGINAHDYSTSDLGWGAFNSINPALVFYQLGRNDLNNGNTVATIQTNVTSQITKIRSEFASSYVQASIVYGMDWNDKLGVSAVDTYANWRTAMLQMAQSDGSLAFFDWSKIIPTIQTTAQNALGITQTDFVHPSPTVGHPLMAQAFFNFICYKT
jgi:hypothetical protein